MTDVVATEPARAPRQVIEVMDAIPVLDTARFEHMQRIAAVMARSSLLPDSLTSFGKRDEKEPLPFEQVLANAFLVVNQAVRWGLDPFAVAQCVSVVHGKLCYEGKLVAAVIEAKAGIRLHHYFVGDGESRRVYMSDAPFTADIVASLKPGARPLGTRMFDGSVSEWKTTGAGTPWTPKNFDRMLIYRGTRDWTRIYEPALMLGVYTDDEMMDLADNARAERARPVSGLAQRLPGAGSAGFSAARIEDQIKETEVTTSSGEGQATAASFDGPATDMTSDQEVPAGASAGVQDRCESTPAPIPASSEEEIREAGQQPLPMDLPAEAIETELTVEETAAPISNLSDPDAGTDGSDGREERESRPTPESLSSNDRETLHLFVDALAAERSAMGLRDAKRQTFGDKVPPTGSALAAAANAIYGAHQRRVKGEITIAECDRLCREARQ